MRLEFPFLSIGKLADSYEAGKSVEGEFFDSWDRVERFYEMQRVLPRDPILRFIGDLRRAGYDRAFRAGQSLVTLILSRSRRHGLRPDQPCIRLEFSFNVSELAGTLRIGTEENSFMSAVALSAELSAALAKLAECPID